MRRKHRQKSLILDTDDVSSGTGRAAEQADAIRGVNELDHASFTQALRPSPVLEKGSLLEFSLGHHGQCRERRVDVAHDNGFQAWNIVKAIILLERSHA